MGAAKFEFKAFQCAAEDLERTLNTLGTEGYRLHSCDTLIDTNGRVYYSAVMERMVVIEDDEPQAPAAMAMKG